MNTWIVIAGIAVGTYVLRASMLVALAGRTLPPSLDRPMAMLGPAALAAMIWSMLFTSDGEVAPRDLPTVAAAAIGYLVVRRTGSVAHALVVGLPTFWLATAAGV